MGILVDQVRVGHATDEVTRTGCTVVLCPNGAVAGVDVRGAAPGTRETDLLRPGNLVDHVHAVLLTGGSAFGLAAADGVMRWLHERNIGFPIGSVHVPIVPAAVLFDLHVGRPAWPDAAMGYAACVAADSDALTWGRIGAGTGATVGKLLGLANASPGGIGMARMTLPNGVVVAAVVVVNARGHIIDPRTGQILAGPRLPDGSFADSVRLLLEGSTQAIPSWNTTLGCIVTTARLDKAGCCRVASMAHQGLVRTIRPVHTQHDGDTLFTIAVGSPEAPAADITLIGVAAAEVVAEAVVNAVRGEGSSSA
jgi:L-aminopeptidase/D-esterase-like protein